MSGIRETDTRILEIMYEGDKKRDASSKIRGFLFQDYVAITCLLQEHVKYVCLEYIEDVDVILDDDTFQYIQVKYYPRKNLKMDEVATDLYYQYLRFQMLHSTFKIKPQLYIHGGGPVAKPTIEKLKQFFDPTATLQRTVTFDNTDKEASWLTKNINGELKEKQKRVLFAKYASEATLGKFAEEFTIFSKPEINEFKQQVMNKLSDAYPNHNGDADLEHWQLLLLGLAVVFVQRRYLLVDPGFKELRLDKEKFDQHMRISSQTMKEDTIACYLAGVACDEYGEIVKNNDLSALQSDMLNLIFQKTVQWISAVCSTVDGQYQFLNTISVEDGDRINEYKKKTVTGKLRTMAECRYAFISFLDYLWKIMLNICQEEVKTEADISKRESLFNPTSYINPNVQNYICLHFPDDINVLYSVILPPANGKFEVVTRKLVARMVNLSPKPGKWFFENNKLIRGQNFYDYSTADIIENPTVADLGNNSFYIECMDCIGIDRNEWCRQEACRECIFSVKCVKGGK